MLVREVRSTQTYARNWRRSAVFIIKFEYISHIFSFDFEQVNVSWHVNSFISHNNTNIFKVVILNYTTFII